MGQQPSAGEEPLLPPSRSVREHAAWLSIGATVYTIALALIAFWPQPVDSGAGPLLRWITDHVPLMTYERIEFGSNILLFVPGGAGLALLLPRMRYLVVPIALVASVAIESVQAVLLTDRTPSIQDVIANVTGACVGLVGAVIFQQMRRRRGRAARE